MNEKKFLKNILLSDIPSILIKENIDIILKLIPELKNTIDFNQYNDYHQYDVFEHIIHVIDNTSNNYILRISALFHDIGKPICFRKDESGIGHFYEHWEESIKIFDKYSNLFEISFDDKELITKLIFYHDLEINSDNYNSFKDIFKDNIGLLIELKKADILAQSSKYINRIKVLEDIVHK